MARKKHQKKSEHKLRAFLFVLLLLTLIAGGMYAIWPVPEKNGPSLPKKTITESTIKKSVEPKNALSASIEQELVKRNFSGTALVFKNGKVILNKAYGWQDQAKKIHNTVATQYCIGSVQKGQTAYLIMQAVKADKLFLAEKLSDFYPQIPNSQHISIKDMLNMSSGLRIDEKKITTLNTTDPKKILAETLQQTTLAPNASYSYQPVNYVLLAGILEKINHTDYSNLFDKTIKKSIGLKETSFYSTNNSNQALSYSQTAAGPVYSPNTASSYADELGTGNVFMSANDLYQYFKSLFNDKFLTQQDRNELWYTYPGEKYASGIYDMGNNYHARGVKARFETVADFSKDGKNGILLLSNVWNEKKGYNNLSAQLYKKVVAVPKATTFKI